MLTVNKAQYPDDKVEAAILQDDPVPQAQRLREKEVWLNAGPGQRSQHHGRPLIVFSLLNTQQFIFIQ
jgi:hypothetical protein